MTVRSAWLAGTVWTAVAVGVGAHLWIQGAGLLWLFYTLAAVCLSGVALGFVLSRVNSVPSGAPTEGRSPALGIQRRTLRRVGGAWLMLFGLGWISLWSLAPEDTLLHFIYGVGVPSLSMTGYAAGIISYGIFAGIPTDGDEPHSEDEEFSLWGSRSQRQLQIEREMRQSTPAPGDRARHVQRGY